MANLKDIKVRIASVQKTQQITKAMKMVAASKMKRATDAIISARPYANKLESLIHGLEATDVDIESHLLEEREVKKVLMIVVAADKGLCGGFNSNIRKETIQRLNDYKAKNIDPSLYVIGKKAYEFCSKIGVELKGQQIDIFKDLQFNSASEVMSKSLTLFENMDVDKVEIIYNKFVNAITQEVTVNQLLPLQMEVDEDAEPFHKDYIFEPSKVELMSLLIPRHLNFQVWKALLESNASEQAARMMAMDSATNNAGDMIKKLKQIYNKIRQASITTEISEIVGGAAALQD